MEHTKENCPFAMVAMIAMIFASSVNHAMAHNVHDSRSKIEINLNGSSIMRDGSIKPIVGTKTSNAGDEITAIRAMDDTDDFVSIEIDDQQPIKNQIHALTRQMSAIFQHEWKVTMRKAAKELLEADFQLQLEQLR